MKTPEVGDIYAEIGNGKIHRIVKITKIGDVHSICMDTDWGIDNENNPLIIFEYDKFFKYIGKAKNPLGLVFELDLEENKNES